MSRTLSFSVLAQTVFLALAVSSSFAQVASSKDGMWDDPATWSTGAVPPRSARVTIGHTVTIRSPLEHGDGSSSGFVIEVLPRGTLRLAGAGLRLRGSVLINDGILELTPGSALSFAPDAATTLALQIGAAPNQQRARLMLNCSSAARCLVERSAGSSGTAWIHDGGYAGGGGVTGSDTDFLRLGSAGVPAIRTAPSGASLFSLSRTRFLTGGGLETSAHIGAEATLRLRNVTWRDTLAPAALVLTAYGSAAAGVREIHGCVFDKPALFFPPQDLSITGNIFLDGFDLTDAPWARFEGNLVRHGGDDHRIGGDIRGNYWFVDNPNRLNPHIIQAGVYPRDVVIENEVIEFNGFDGNGDSITIGEPPVPITITIAHVLILPNAAQNGTGTLFSALGNQHITLFVEHNTYFTGFQGAATNETYGGHTGMIGSFRSNLAWDSVPRGYKLFDTGTNDTVIDLGRAENIDFNSGFNVLDGSRGRGYHNLEFSSGAPGVHDVDTDPRFVDPTRRIAAWDLSLGGPGNDASALQKLSQLNDPDFDSRYSVAALHTWVREGFRPRNPALVAAHDGLTIGALPLFNGEPLPTPTLAAPSYPSPTGVPAYGAPAAPPAAGPSTATPAIATSWTPERDEPRESLPGLGNDQLSAPPTRLPEAASTVGASGPAHEKKRRSKAWWQHRCSRIAVRLTQNFFKRLATEGQRVRFRKRVQRCDRLKLLRVAQAAAFYPSRPFPQTARHD